MHQKLFKLALSLILVLGLMPSMAFAAPAKNAQSNEGAQKTPLTSALVQEPVLKDNIETGTWGDCEWTWDHTTETITVKPGTSGEAGFKEEAPWYYSNFSQDNPNGGVKHIIFSEDNGEKVKLPEDCEGLFSPVGSSGIPDPESPSTIESISFDGADTSAVKNMEFCFDYCYALTSLDLSGLDTSKVTTMRGLFRYCTSLMSLNLTGINTENVERMNDMFVHCESLESVDVSSLNTSKVRLFQSMFSSCISLKSIDLTTFNTEMLGSTQSMFSYCESLESVNLSGFNTPNLENTFFMFYNCKSLKSIDLSSFDTSKVTSANEMFSGCESLEKVILGEKVTKLGLLPAYEIKGHTDWYSSAASNWFTSQEINDGRLGTADIYTKEAPKKSIASTVIPNIENVTYTGSEIKPTLHITDGNYALQEGIDYTLSYENNINPGTATVKITGIGKYEGTISKNFTINPKSIAGVSVAGIENKTYTGSALTQSPKLTDGNYVLREGVDYTLSYKNNVNPGTATLIIEGIGKYTDSITKTFTITSAIKPSKPVITVQPVKKTTINEGTTKPFSISVKAKATRGGKLSYQWYSNGKAIKGATKATYTIKNPSALKPGSYNFYCMVSEQLLGGKTTTKSNVSTLTILAPLSFVQMTPQGKTALTLTWNKENAADGYDVFFSRCNHGTTNLKCKKIKTIKGNATTTFTKTKLLANTCYKAYVRPFKVVSGKKVYLAQSPQVHAYTNGGSQKYSNPKALALNAAKAGIKAKASFQLKAKVTLVNAKKKVISEGHAPVVRYVSSDTSVAKVSKTGKIVGVAKGSCTIYAITQNGIVATCKVEIS